MEAVDGRQQSGHHSLNQSDRYDSYKRNENERPYSNMATSIVTPTTLYPSHPHPPPYSHSALPSPHPLSNLMSPTDTLRRYGEDKSIHNSSQPQSRPPPQKQSLPSIHEALGGEPKSAPVFGAPSPAKPPTTSPHQPSPTTYAPPPPSISQSYSSESSPYPTPSHVHSATQRSPPQPIHPQAASTLPRPDPLTPSFSDGMRHSSISSMSSRNGPASQGASFPPPFEQRPAERMSLTNGYTHQPPPQQPPYDYASAQNKQAGGSYPQNYHHAYPAEHAPRPVDMIDGTSGRRWPVVKRHLDIFDLEINLADITSSSKSMMDFANHYHRITQESQRSGPPPERMPSLGEIHTMSSHVDRIGAALQNIKEKLLEQQQIKDDQYARMQNGKVMQDEYGDDNNSMYGNEDLKNQVFGVPDGKKRRGRAAPPGRCHSCNRAETPEWRRGPDGARTLCNACGLHYAKLTRKLGSKNNQAQPLAGSAALRPKSAEGNMPRS